IPGGAGALRSTAADMLTFLVANLDSTRAPLSRTLQQTHGERHATDNPNLKIGLAWHILSRPAGTIVWHNGGTGGYRSFIGFDPARHVAVVVLCNNGNENVDDIGFHLLDETFPLSPPRQRHTEVAVDSLILQRYVGEYELAPTFHIVITREAAHLFAQATAQPRFAIFAESDSTFFAREEGPTADRADAGALVLRDEAPSHFRERRIVDQNDFVPRPQCVGPADRAFQLGAPGRMLDRQIEVVTVGVDAHLRRMVQHRMQVRRGIIELHGGDRVV